MQEQPGIAPTPLEFASDTLGVKLWSKQQEVLGSLVEHRRVAVKSGNGLGKGFCAAVALLWFLHTHQDAAIVLSTWRTRLSPGTPWTCPRKTPTSSRDSTVQT